LAPRAVAEGLAAAVQVIDLTASEFDPDRRLSDLEHPVTAYLNGLAPSSRRPQLSALDWIARRATQLYTAETLPWHRLRRPHLLKIRGLLEEHYQPATANRMLAALRGVLKECWQAQLLSIEESASAPAAPGGSVVSAGSRRSSRPPPTHDLRRTWIGDLLDLGVDLATVQKMAGHASASTTGRYDRRDQSVQQRAAALLHVPYVWSRDLEVRAAPHGQWACRRPSSQHSLAAFE
jgi:hypothetical protein